MVLYCIYVQVDYRQSVRNLPRAKPFAESGLISVTTSPDDLPVIYCFIDITLYIIRRFIHELPMIFCVEMPADMSICTFHLIFTHSNIQFLHL